MCQIERILFILFFVSRLTSIFIIFIKIDTNFFKQLQFKNTNSKYKG